jgi:hypothetical protein
MASAAGTSVPASPETVAANTGTVAPLRRTVVQGVNRHWGIVGAQARRPLRGVAEVPAQLGTTARAS